MSFVFFHMLCDVSLTEMEIGDPIYSLMNGGIFFVVSVDVDCCGVSGLGRAMDVDFGWSEVDF